MQGAAQLAISSFQQVPELRLQKILQERDNPVAVVRPFADFPPAGIASRLLDARAFLIFGAPRLYRPTDADTSASMLRSQE
jgi:hypothetical protein